MDARILRAVILLSAFWSLGASARSKHFIVTAPTDEVAKQVAQAAEQYRHNLAVEWTGRELPPWADVCPIRVVLNRPASGETSFEFPVGGGHPRNWRMTVEGSIERVMDSVLPHEILHTVFATHFQNPLPRWADEGACTTVEGSTERQKHHVMLVRFLKGDDGIPFNEMFRMREYPRNILPLYSQGHSVASFLVAQEGKRAFVDYVGRGMKTNNWTEATRHFYGYESLSELQLKWVDWVGKGSPSMDRPQSQTFLAASRQQRPELGAIAQTGATRADRTLVSQSFQQPRGVSSLGQSSQAQVRVNSPLAQPPRPLPVRQAARPIQGDSGWYRRHAKEFRSLNSSQRISNSKASSHVGASGTAPAQYAPTRIIHSGGVILR